MTHVAPAAEKTYITASDFGLWLKRGVQALRRDVARIDRINVFPVPDGDTGHNMLGTLEAAWEAVEESASRHLGHLVRVAAQGAVSGARGNSGTILSQVLVGMAESGGEKEVWSIPDFRQAWEQAAEVAYQGVYQPVEGTMLTLIRALAENAHGDTVLQVLHNMVVAARKTVLDSPRLLSVLRERGVVDAGAEGLYLVIAAFLGDEVAELSAEILTQRNAMPTSLLSQEIPFPYDTEALIAPWSGSLPLSRIRELLAGYGDSVVVSEMQSSLKIHVHVAQPEPLMIFLFQLGPVVQMEMLDMRHQMQNLAQRELRPVVIRKEWASIMPIRIDVVDPNSPAAEALETLWIGPGAEGRRYSVESLGVACQLFLDYDEEVSWEDNLRNLLPRAKTMTSLTIRWDVEGYWVGDVREKTRQSALAAVKGIVGRHRLVTIYTSPSENEDNWNGEAEWWQAQLNAEVVSVPGGVAHHSMNLVVQ